MQNDLKVIATSETPEIHFSFSGKMEIIGKSVPENGNDFWEKAMNWFNDYLLNPANKTTFDLQIDYLNTSSSIYILQLLYRLNELSERGFKAEVIWGFHSNDFDMLEVGKDYEHMVKVPFTFYKIEEEVCL
ncbi:MAG: DUF1987 domain-containing protein [Crocinitomicaceae bacterium]|nr:DUF1987 domain-containing protein [Crocinitomicaceae bacterium]